ncbi:MAG: GNAT family N-acetyltransferase [Armatimonadota bacterium]
MELLDPSSSLRPSPVGLSSSDHYRTQIVRTPAEWQALEPEWRELHAASTAGEPALSWEWLSGWWRHYGPAYAREDALRVVLVRRGSELVGALPLYLQRSYPMAPRRLLFLSTGELEREETCPDYLDLLTRPGHEEAASREVWSTLQGVTIGPWDELALRGAAADSLLLSGAARHMITGCAVETEPVSQCVIADLSGGFDAYLQGRSGSFRKQARRLLRAAEKEGLELSVASGAAETRRYFGELVALHQRRWTAAGKPGVFSAPRFLEFHSELAVRLGGARRALLARLGRGDEALGVIYGFLAHGRFEFYQCGIHAQAVGQLESPGLALQLLLMQWLAEQGVREWDFLRGSAGYKSRFASRERELVELTVRRHTMRNTAARGARLSGRGVRKLLRSFHGGVVTGPAGSP